MWKHWVLLCVLVALCHIEARRGGRGNRRRGRGRGESGPPGATIEGQWVHLLPNNVRASESAFSLGDQLHMVSKDKQALKSAQMKSSKTVFDFTEGAPPMVVVKVKRRCYLLTGPESESWTRETLQEMIRGFNTSGQRRGASTQEKFATPLSEEQSSGFQSRPLLVELCRRKPPMALASVRPSPSGGRKEKTMTVSSLEYLLSITKSRGRGRGNGRRQRRRQGGREGGRQ